MATKCTVAVVGTVVIVMSAFILIYGSLSSNTLCAQTGESVNEISRTERSKVGQPETASSVTSNTTSATLSTEFAFPPSSTDVPSSSVAFQMHSTAHFPSTVTFRRDSTFLLSSELASSTNSVTHSSSSLTTKSNSTNHYSSELTSSSISGVNSSSELSLMTAASSLLIFPSAMYPSGTTSLLSTTSTAQLSSAAGVGTPGSRNEGIGPNTVLSSTQHHEENVTSRVSLSSAPEEKTEDLFESDMQRRPSGIDVIQAANSSSIHSPPTLPRNEFRNIINVPKRNCGNGEKRDAFGICRPLW